MRLHKACVLLIVAFVAFAPAVRGQPDDTGCVTCHKGIEDMHSGRVAIGCTECHGGNGSATTKVDGHVQARFPSEWKSSANPVRSYTLLNREDPAFIQFVNPGDLRVAAKTCGPCHAAEVRKVSTSMMKTGAMLWGSALYNNGSVAWKDPHYGESYGADGTPQRIQAAIPPSPEETRTRGWLPFLEPLPRWEITQMANLMRTFERGGRKPPETGLPDPQEPAGRPTQNLLSSRDLGTQLRVDPVMLGLQKTRLFDPLLSFLGTNDQPGDYRSSGCTACHVIYANDRDPFHSGPYAASGHNGLSQSGDATIPRNEPGHPIKHQLTRVIPSSQCIVCHVHPGTNVVNAYYGTQWWDLETDGRSMYPAKEFDRSDAKKLEIAERNPEGSALKGLWGDPKFLESITSLNDRLQHTQFADFTGHGWIFRSVFKKDRKGTLLDIDGNPVAHSGSDALQKAVQSANPQPGEPVHLKDIHLEKGMHCIDCHFRNDVHGNGNLYGETRNAVEIDCVNCHGTIDKRADPTSPGWLTAAAAGGTPMTEYQNTPFDEDRFFWKEGRLFQRSAVEKDKVWEVIQVKDTVTPGAAHYSEKSARAKLMLQDGTVAQAGVLGQKLAHANQQMTCFACHSSWVPSCFGCHLSMKANQKRPTLHNEGEESRNWTSYNFQTLRDDVFMLGKDGTVTGHRIAPIRSSCAVLVSSQNANREWIYSQQQTVSAEGYSGEAFSPNFPHTVRTTETRACTDCHVAANNDNNAVMAQSLMLGTNFYNFIGRFAYVATGKDGFDAVAVTEQEEPQAVIGSYLHSLAYPSRFALHRQRNSELQEAQSQKASGEILQVQLRGEYLYAAAGQDGLQVFDVANIANKGFSQRMISSPVSPLGQKINVPTRYATSVALPSTLVINPRATHLPENEEADYRDDAQPIHPLYSYVFVTDREEGVIAIDAQTLMDGNPENNFLKRALTFNPDGLLNGAQSIAFAGVYAYVLCDLGLVVLNFSEPLKPRVSATLGEPFLLRPHAVQVQFRYAFVCDAQGVKVLDITQPDHPQPVPSATIQLAEARNIYLARTYAYVAAGAQGLVILDVENPEKPRIDQVFSANGSINDTRDVKIGMTNTSLFAYLADGKNGLRVVQLTSPETPGYDGFSPRPVPALIESHKTQGPALAISEGLDRDRAVDESGNQLAVFGRRGSRPLNLPEMQRLYLRNGQLYTVTDR